MIPAHILAQLFVSDDDFNASGGNEARNAAMRYIYNKTRSLPNPPEGLSVGLHKTANIVRLSINALVKGRSVQGSKEWTEQELLDTDRPITHLFDKVIDSIFEIPSETRL